MLRNFVAVMKDSYREAVDGFIIYVMLGLAALTILIAASYSFDPEPADAAFPFVTQHFTKAFRNRGADSEEVGSRVRIEQFTQRSPIPLAYSATDVQKLDAGKDYPGKYKLRLTVSAQQGRTTQPGERGGGQGGRNLENAEQDVNVAFRTVVYCWKQSQVPEQFALINTNGNASEPPNAELLPDEVDAEAELAKRGGFRGGWILYAVPRPLAVDSSRRTFTTLADLLKGGDAGEMLFQWLKGEFRRQAGVGLKVEGGGKEAADKAKLPEFLARELWKVVKRERPVGEVESLTRDDLTRLIQAEVSRMDDELKATVGTVTDADMQDFIRNQFLLHGDMDKAEVVRRPSTTNQRGEPTDYRFDVEVEVKLGAKGWPYRTKALFGAFGGGEVEPFGEALMGVQDILVNTIGASVTLLVAIILTGFFIPNMLRKGSLDLLLVKPMSRFELLLYKYMGGLIFMLLVTGITVGGVWLVLAVRSGNWNPVFLLSILFITFIFAVLYAVSTLVAVLTRSAIAAILLTSLFMVFMALVGGGKWLADRARLRTEKEEDKKGWYYTTIDVLNDGLPRYNDVMKLNSLALREAYHAPAKAKEARQIEPPSWFASVGISVAYIVVFFGLAYLRFLFRDP